jgi:hypothetical protein
MDLHRAAGDAVAINFVICQYTAQELGVSGVKLKSQVDGSGVGAAVTAAVYVLHPPADVCVSHVYVCVRFAL